MVDGRRKLIAEAQGKTLNAERSFVGLQRADFLVPVSYRPFRTAQKQAISTDEPCALSVLLYAFQDF
jgi:hypothetical protein